MRRIYLDHASATALLPVAREAMLSACGTFGNPGSIHEEGVSAAASLKRSRERIAKILGVKARELIFTSGGTEGNNLAILGFAKALRRSVERKGADGLSGTHWIVSSIEHPSVLECFQEIEFSGGSVDFIEPDARGLIVPQALALKLRPETAFVSIGWANGEIGTIQAVAELSGTIRAHEAKHGTLVAFHSDAGQAPLYEPAVLNSLGVDLLTLDSGKFGGPRGIGALYLSNRVRLAPLMLGGSQERGLRAGTENVAAAAGFAAAYEEIADSRKIEAKRARALRDAFAKSILALIPGAVVNGSLKRALPHVLNVSIPGISSEYVALSLDDEGIMISTKSACREGEASKSHVVAAISDESWRAENTLRFSLGADTRAEDLEYAARELARVIERHRSGPELA